MIRTPRPLVRRASLIAGTLVAGTIAATAPVGAATALPLPTPTCTITLAPPAGAPAEVGQTLTATATIGLNGLSIVTPIVTASIVPAGSTTPLASLSGPLSAGGNQVTYLLTSNDVGKQLVALGDLTSALPAIPGVPSLFQCTSTPVTVVEAPTSPGSTTLGATPVSSSPRIVGKMKRGKRVHADLGTVQPGVSVSYQWFKKRKHHAARAIAGANGQVIKLKRGLAHKRVYVVVTYTKPGYTPTVLGSGSRRVR